MKAFLLVALVLSASLGRAQVPDDAKPASTNVPGQDYPRVYPDHRIAFRIKAPDAQKVQVQLGKAYEMEKSADGVWSVTLPAQAEGFHYYSFVIDGVQVSDPASESFFGVSRMSSGVEVPAEDAAFYTVQDVAHGQVRTQ